MGDPARPMSYVEDASLALRAALAGHDSFCPACGGHKEFTPCAAALRLRAALRCLDWSVPLRAEDAAVVRDG